MSVISVLSKEVIIYKNQFTLLSCVVRKLQAKKFSCENLLQEWIFTPKAVLTINFFSILQNLS